MDDLAVDSLVHNEVQESTTLHASSTSSLNSDVDGTDGNHSNNFTGQRSSLLLTWVKDDMLERRDNSGMCFADVQTYLTASSDEVEEQWSNFVNLVMNDSASDVIVSSLYNLFSRFFLVSQSHLRRVATHRPTRLHMLCRPSDCRRQRDV